MKVIMTELTVTSFIGPLELTAINSELSSTTAFSLSDSSFSGTTLLLITPSLKMFTQLCVLVLATFMAPNLVVVDAKGACSERQGMPGINETWLLNTRPNGGWYPVASDTINDGEFLSLLSSVTQTTRKGNKKMCWESRNFQPIPGFTSTVPITYTCTYDYIGTQFCSVENFNPIENPIFNFFPSVVRIAILKTDNNKYLAISICQAGSVETWAILTTEPGGLDPALRREAKEAIRDRGISVREEEQTGIQDVEPNNVMKGGRVRISTCARGQGITGVVEGIKDAGQVSN